MMYCWFLLTITLHWWLIILHSHLFGIHLFYIVGIIVGHCLLIVIPTFLLMTIWFVDAILHLLLQFILLIRGIVITIPVPFIVDIVAPFTWKHLLLWWLFHSHLHCCCCCWFIVYSDLIYSIVRLLMIDTDSIYYPTVVPFDTPVLLFPCWFLMFFIR